MSLTSHMQACADACAVCHNTCEQTLFQHCLDMGGRHMERKHVNVMIDCIELCQLSTSFILRGSENAAELCRLCADICDDCANACEGLDDEKMDACADACRDCADICRNVMNMPMDADRENVAGRARKLRA